MTGVGIIPGLAQQSRTDLAAAGATNVSIVTGEGTALEQEQPSFGRVMITAGVWDLPSFLFDQVVDGGLVLAPLELRGSEGCQVSVLRRNGDGFRSDVTLPGRFVPLVGRGQARPDPTAREVATSDESIGAPRSRRSLLLGSDPSLEGGPIALEFRAFLGADEAPVCL